MSLVKTLTEIIIQSGEKTHIQDISVKPVTFNIIKAKSSAFDNVPISIVFIIPLLNSGCRLI